MFTEKNFKNALEVMNFEKISDDVYEKNFAENISMSIDFKNKKLFYPKNLKIGRDTIKNFLQNENFVVFECVNRLLDKGYRPEDIFLEKSWQLGHNQKSGIADICVSHHGEVFLIIECKTFGTEFNHELENLKSDGGQLFSYWQQENSCQWLVLYASNFDGEKIIFNSASVSCVDEIYKNASNATEKFNLWNNNYHKQLASDVIFHEDSSAYNIGVRPFRKKDLIDFDDTGVVNKFEEILRHNSVTNKQNAFDALLELFICKLVDEAHNGPDDEVDFQFKFGVDNHKKFIDRLQNLYHQGMEEFMNISTTYTPLSVVENLLKQNQGESRKVLEERFKQEFDNLKFYTPNMFNFIKVLNRDIFYMNSKVVVEVVDAFKDYKIIGAKNLQTLGDMFEQLLDKGFKQDEGQFFTPLPITKFIWNCLPLEKIISAEKHFAPPKVIDYACGAGHFLTQGFEAINDFTKNTLPEGWEDKKLFGIEKNDRLSTVSKISMFMHGANKTTIKFGDGLENYPNEGIEPESFDILVSNPPYSVKDFKQHLKLENKLTILEKISNNGSEIETLFVERIAQLLKPGGIAAVVLPSSILSGDKKSLVATRENILQNFYVRAIAEFGSKTFSATGTKTDILFLEKISDPPQKFDLFADTVNGIFNNDFNSDWDNNKIFSAWLDKIKVTADDYKAFISREVDYTELKNISYFADYVTAFENSSDYKNKIKQVTFQKLSDAEKIAQLNQMFYNFAEKIEREKIQYFAQTYTQTTLVISAPEKNKSQKNFLGYSWSSEKGKEGIKISGEGLMSKLTVAVQKYFFGEKISLPDVQKYFYYLNLANMLDFNNTKFTKKIDPKKKNKINYSGKFKRISLEKVFEKIETGSRPKGGVSQYTDGILSLGGEHIDNSNGYLNLENKKFVPKDFFANKTTGRIEKNNILLCKDGALTGKIAIVRDELKNNFALANEHIFVLKNSDEILQWYLFYYLFSSEGQQQIKENITGMAQGGISRNNLQKILIPMPPKEQREKIVAEFKNLDEKIETAQKNDKEKYLSERDELVKKYFS